MRLTERSLIVPVSESLYSWLVSEGKVTKTPPGIVVRQMLDRLMDHGK